MKHLLVLETLFDSKISAEKALLAFPREEFKSRAHIHTYVEDTKLIVRIEAEDSVALRALVNSYLRYMNIIEGIGGTNEE